MRRIGLIAPLLLLSASGAALAADTPAPRPGTAPPGAGSGQSGDAAAAAVSGSHTYRTHCASCHGSTGKGDGPMADNLRYHPADLTLIAHRHGGSFPTEKVIRIVDGREPVKGHGGPDMPIWGDAFKNADANYDERAVREKIRLVVEYLRTLQEK